MIFDIRSIAGASLPRTQQVIILAVGLCLTGLLAWRAGLLWPHAPVSASPHRYHFIEVRGESPRPGVQVFWAPPTVQQAWEAAGGLEAVPQAGLRLESGAKITVAPDRTVTVARMAGPDLLSLGLAIDPNQATAADLEAVPGLGPVLAQRLVEYRDAHGSFANLEDLLAIKGMGPKILEKIRPYMVIIADSEKTPEDVKEIPPWHRKIPPFKTLRP